MHSEDYARSYDKTKKEKHLSSAPLNFELYMMITHSQLHGEAQRGAEKQWQKQGTKVTAKLIV